jgi:hypothetical protein
MLWKWDIKHGSYVICFDVTMVTNEYLLTPPLKFVGDSSLTRWTTISFSRTIHLLFCYGVPLCLGRKWPHCTSLRWYFPALKLNQDFRLTKWTMARYGLFCAEEVLLSRQWPYCARTMFAGVILCLHNDILVMSVNTFLCVIHYHPTIRCRT